MSSQDHTELNRQINAEAARWFVEFRSGDVDVSSRRAFDAWLRASPEHVRAFIEIAGLWGRGPELDPQRRFSIEALVASAREDRKIIALGLESDPARTSEPRLRGRAMAVGAAILLLVVGSSITWFMFQERDFYGTQVGEQRSLGLSDGSTLILNSKSRARVAYSESTRDIELIEGEALFRVMKDSSRPFIVRTEGAVVQAIGTEFDVNRRSKGTVVTVVEGRVAVFPAAVRDGFGVTLSAGEQTDVAGGAADTPTRANVNSATAWVQRKVILQAATLEEVAEDFNRYSERPLVVEEHAEVPFRLSGVFSADPQFLVRFLRERSDIQVRETATEIRIIHAGAN